MNQPNISRLHTSCKNCIFAIYDGDTQTICQMARLHNEEVIEVYDDERKFNVINNVKCHYKRTKSWADKVKIDDWKKRVLEENRIKYQVLIFLERYHTLEQLQHTIKSLLNQRLKPQHITVIKKPLSNINLSSIHQYLKTLEIPWKLQDVVNTNLNNLMLIDDAIRMVSYPYYAVFQAGLVIPMLFFDTISSEIFNKHLRFGVLMNDERPVVVSTLIHKVFGGNGKSSLIKKLRKEECHSLIKKIQEVYPNYPELH